MYFFLNNDVLTYILFLFYLTKRLVQHMPMAEHEKGLQCIFTSVFHNKDTNERIDLWVGE